MKEKELGFCYRSATERTDNELVFVRSAQDAKKAVTRAAGGKQLFAVTDENVARLYPELLPENNVYVIDAGEESKTLAVAQKICRAMLESGMTRNAVVAAFGGGVTGDIAGFVSSVYMRGVEFCNVPTTLLAQVDSAIGGKTAVNLDGYKNMIGSFKMPSRIIICPELLSTLPSREWRSGLGELVKTAFLCEELYGFVKENIAELVNRVPLAAEKAVEKAARFKKKITDEDFTEKGTRKILNLGHTVGHALEKCDGHKYSHGEYVLLGMKIEFEMLSIADTNAEFAAESGKLLGAAGLPALPNISPEEVTAAAKTDKKNSDGKISVIGLAGAGKAFESEFSATEFCSAYSKAVNALINKGELSRVGNQN